VLCAVVFIGLGLGGCVSSAVTGAEEVMVRGIMFGPAFPRPFGVVGGVGEEPGVFWCADPVVRSSQRWISSAGASPVSVVAPDATTDVLGFVFVACRYVAWFALFSVGDGGFDGVGLWLGSVDLVARRLVFRSVPSASSSAVGGGSGASALRGSGFELMQTTGGCRARWARWSELLLCSGDGWNWWLLRGQGSTGIDPGRRTGTRPWFPPMAGPICGSQSQGWRWCSRCPRFRGQRLFLVLAKAGVGEPRLSRKMNSASDVCANSVFPGGSVLVWLSSCMRCFCGHCLYGVLYSYLYCICFAYE
jgi:hypothetical protein